MDSTRNFTNAWNLIRGRKWDQADLYLFGSLSSSMTGDELALMQGLYFALRRNFMKALEAAESIAPESSLYRNAVILRARLLLLLRRPADAWEVILANHPILREIPGYSRRLGFRLLKYGEFRKAKNAFRVAILNQPGSAALHIGLARSFEGLRSWKRAARHRLAASGAGHNSYPHRISLINDLIKAGRFDDARDLIQTLRTEGKTDAQLSVFEAEIAFRSGEFDVAIPLLDSLKATLPDRVELYVWRGYIERQKGNDGAASEYFDAAFELGSLSESLALTVKEVAKALIWLGGWHYQVGNWQRALKSWRSALAFRQQHGLRTLNPSYYDYRMAECHWHLGDVASAAALVHSARAAGTDRARPVHHLILARYQAESGDLEGAKASLIAASHQFPTDSSLLIALAEIMLDLGEIEAAEEIWIQAARQDETVRLNHPIKLRLETALHRSIRDDQFFQARHTTPPSFRIPDDLGLAMSRRSLISGLANSWRAAYALMLRRSVTQFGNTALGYIWALLQPMMLFGVLLAAFYAIDRKVPPGMTVEIFLLTGIVPFRLFFHTHGTVSSALHSHRSLFYLQHITPFVAYIATGIMDILTYTTAFYLLFFAFQTFHESVDVESHLVILLCLFCLGLFGLTLGMVTAVLSQRWPFIDAIFVAIKRGLFFISGAFFYANELPKTIRDILLLNPIFHLLEFLRDGVFVAYTAHYASIGYVAVWLLGMTLAALVADRLGRRRAFV